MIVLAFSDGRLRVLLHSWQLNEIESIRGSILSGGPPRGGLSFRLDPHLLVDHEKCLRSSISSKWSSVIVDSAVRTGATSLTGDSKSWASFPPGTSTCSNCLDSAIGERGLIGLSRRRGFLLVLCGSLWLRKEPARVMPRERTIIGGV